MYGVVPEGALCALLGPSGSGKSGLLDLLTGRTDYGRCEREILFKGESIYRYQVCKRRYYFRRFYESETGKQSRGVLRREGAARSNPSTPPPPWPPLEASTSRSGGLVMKVQAYTILPAIREFPPPSSSKSPKLINGCMDPEKTILAIVDSDGHVRHSFPSVAPQVWILTKCPDGFRAACLTQPYARRWTPTKLFVVSFSPTTITPTPSSATRWARSVSTGRVHQSIGLHAAGQHGVP